MYVSSVIRDSIIAGIDNIVLTVNYNRGFLQYHDAVKSLYYGSMLILYYLFLSLLSMHMEYIYAYAYGDNLIFLVLFDFVF